MAPLRFEAMPSVLVACVAIVLAGCQAPRRGNVPAGSHDCVVTPSDLVECNLISDDSPTSARD